MRQECSGGPSGLVAGRGRAAEPIFRSFVAVLVLWWSPGAWSRLAPAFELRAKTDRSGPARHNDRDERNRNSADLDVGASPAQFDERLDQASKLRGAVADGIGRTGFRSHLADSPTRWALRTDLRL